MRITIPTHVGDLIKLAQAIEKKHAELGEASPLNGIKQIEQFKPQTDLAAASHDEAETLQRQAEMAIETRDNALGADTTTPGYVRFFVTSARDTLLGLNKGAEHQLGEWGFTVTASPKSNPGSTPEPPAPDATA